MSQAVTMHNPVARTARALAGRPNFEPRAQIYDTGFHLSHVVSRAATLRVAGAPEGCRFAAAGPNNVSQVFT